VDRRQFLLLSLSTVSVAGLGALAACTATQEIPMPSVSENPAAAPTPTPSQRRKVLVAYFSRPGENYYYGDRIILETGNTQVVAEMIAVTASVDLYRIEATDPYPDDYEGRGPQRPRTGRGRTARDRGHASRRHPVRHHPARQPGVERPDADDHAHIHRQRRPYGQGNPRVFDRYCLNTVCARRDSNP